MRGRRPKPTHLKLVTGNPGRRPLNLAEAKIPPAIPKPPRVLAGEALQEWNELAPELYKHGMLTKVDRAALAAYCQAYGRWMKAETLIAEREALDRYAGFLIQAKGGRPMLNPLLAAATRAMADMVRYGSEFGLSPSARSRIQAADAQAEKDPSTRYF